MLISSSQTFAESFRFLIKIDESDINLTAIFPAILVSYWYWKREIWVRFDSVFKDNGKMNVWMIGKRWLGRRSEVVWWGVWSRVYSYSYFLIFLDDLVYEGQLIKQTDEGGLCEALWGL